MAVSFKGITIDISKDSWSTLKAAFPHLVDVPSLSTKDDIAIQISSTDSKDLASSSDIPPGFEHAKRKPKPAKKKASSSHPVHRPFRKHLAMLKKGWIILKLRCAKYSHTEKVACMVRFIITTGNSRFAAYS
ncbi:uncharacterized protein A4U43_C06F11350 [Asparagus officinalis]|uniref:Uncharacterized protein n=1 Tax=Asparagus officinalis TaxID=4686 RepID=A0A5P1EPJ8_ASPOF|nr:uncharacterized protein A4U43_C06F11350 [Asparagus officinalis]